MPTMTVEQLSFANQVIFEELRALPEGWDYGEAGAALMTGEGTPRLLAAILVPEGEEFDRARAIARAERMRRFPAAEAAEALSFFISANQNWIGSVLIAAGIRGGRKRGSGADRIPGRASAQ